jgi:putative Mg2+ transporter-C (MgtC) family protein
LHSLFDLSQESWRLAVELLLRLGIAVLLAGIIGWEREVHGRPAGVRTHMLVALGAALFTEVGRGLGGDSARVAAQVVTGIGFLGAGTIMRMGGEIKGLTTAASIWAVAAIAMAVAAGGPFIIVAVAGTILALITLTWVDKLERVFLKDTRNARLIVEVGKRSDVADLLRTLTETDVHVESVGVQPVDGHFVVSIEMQGTHKGALERVTVEPYVRSAKWAN